MQIVRGEGPGTPGSVVEQVELPLEVLDRMAEVAALARPAMPPQFAIPEMIRNVIDRAIGGDVHFDMLREDG